MPAGSPHIQVASAGADFSMFEHSMISGGTLAFLHFGPIAGSCTPQAAIGF